MTNNTTEKNVSSSRNEAKAKKYKEELQSSNSIFSFMTTGPVTPKKNNQGGNGKMSYFSLLKKSKSPRSVLDTCIDEQGHRGGDCSSVMAVVSEDDFTRNATSLDQERSSINHTPIISSSIIKKENLIYNIVDLNNRGVDAFHSQQYDLATGLFMDAWSSLCKVTRHPGRLFSTEDWSDPIMCSQFTPSSTNMNGYIFQRMDFDEGMNTYNDPERLPHCCSDLSIITSILCYNTAQVYRQSDLLDEALGCLARAQSSLKLPEHNTGDINSSSMTSSPHFIMIAILHTRGQICYRRGCFLDAIANYKEALTISHETFGQKHHTTAYACNSLGVLYYHILSGNQDEAAEDSQSLALQFSDTALSIWKEIRGYLNANVGTVYNNIGRLHVMKDRFKEAIECYNHALFIRSQTLGKGSLDYAATAFNAGQSYHQIQYRDRALELYQEFLHVAEKHFTKNHRDVAVVLSGIAQIHQERGEFDKALDLYKESLEASKNALGECHTEVAMILNRIGNFHFERENYDDAFEAYTKGLNIEKKVLDRNHGNIIVTLSNLGEIHRQRGEWDEALKVFKTVLDMQRSRYRADNTDIATSLHVIGMIYDKQGEANSALTYLQSALLMRRKLHGDNHIDVAFTLSALGNIFSRGNKFKLALDLFNEALRIRKSILGLYHSDVAFSLYNIALIHHKQGSFAEAVEGFLEALKIEKAVLGDEHKDVAITLYKLGDTYKRNNDLDQALCYFKQALEIERLTMVTEDPLTIARTLTEIGNVHLARSEIQEAMLAFVESGRIYQSTSLSPTNVSVDGHQYAFEIAFCDTSPAA